MLQIVIYALEFSIFCLIAVLIQRLRKLNRENNALSPNDSLGSIVINKTNEAPLRSATSKQTKSDSLALAKSFINQQLMDVRRNKELQKIVELEWLNEVSTLYFFGAVNFISKQMKCEDICSKEVVELALKSNKLATGKLSAEQITKITAKIQNESSKNVVYSGAEAAKQWLEKGNIEKGLRLNEQLGWWRYEFLTARFSRKAALAQ